MRQTFYSSFLLVVFNMIQGISYSQATSTIENDQNNWSLQHKIGNPSTTTCGSEKILGGPEAISKIGILSRSYSDFPNHQYMELKFYLWLFGDSEITVDNIALTITDSANPKEFIITGLENPNDNMIICSGNGLTGIGKMTIIITINHTQPTFTLTFAGHYTADDEIFGISDLNIRVFNLSQPISQSLLSHGRIPLPGFTSISDPKYLQHISPCNKICGFLCYFLPIPISCSVCPKDYRFVNDVCCSKYCESCQGPDSCTVNTCKTSTAPFYFWDGSCGSSCDYPLNVTTYGGTTQICNFPCSNSSDFLYWDGSCSSICNSTLNQGSIAGRKLCIFPCPADNFLYWDGSCKPTCPFPLRNEVIKNRKFCRFDCLSTQFLSWNGTCSNSCHPLFSTSIQGMKICNWTCLSSFIFPNKTCTSSCPPHYLREIFESKTICKPPCQSNSYLFWNDSCINPCNPPLKINFTFDINKCEKACPGALYFYANGSCLPNCQYPFKSRIILSEYYCDRPCPASQVLHYDGNCLNACPSPYNTEDKNGVLLCISPCDNTAFLFPSLICQQKCPAPFANKTLDGINWCRSSCREDLVVTNGSSVVCNPSCYKGFNYTFFNGIAICVPICPNGTFYTDGRCLEKCNYPMERHKRNDILLCEKPCPTDQFLNLTDMTCLDSCPYPFNASSELYGIVCRHPCKSVSSFFYPETRACLDNCSFPYKSENYKGVNMCKLECLSPFIFQNNSCICPPGYSTDSNMTFCAMDSMMAGALETASAVTASTYGFMFFGILVGSNPIVIMGLLHLMQSFFYLNFINQVFPINFQQFLDIFTLATFPFLESSTTGVVKNGTLYTTEQIEISSPQKFMDKGYSGYFLMTGALSVLVPIMIIPLAYILKFFVRRKFFSKNKVGKLLKKVYRLVMWSLMIRLWISAYLKISITSFLQLRNLTFTSFKFIISSVLGMIVAIFNTILPILIYKILNKANFLEQKFFYRRIEALYEDYKSNPNKSKSLNVNVIVVSRLIMAISVVFAYEAPLAQNIIPWISNLTCFTFYSYFKPFKAKSENWLNQIYHLGFCLIHTCLFVLNLGDMDVIKIENSRREYIGSILVFLCLTTLITKFFIFVIVIFYDALIQLRNLTQKPRPKLSRFSNKRKRSVNR